MAGAVPFAGAVPGAGFVDGGGACIVYAPESESPNKGVPEAVLFVPPAPGVIASTRVDGGTLPVDRPAAVPMLARGLYLLQHNYGRAPFDQLLIPAEQLARGGMTASPARDNTWEPIWLWESIMAAGGERVRLNFTWMATMSSRPSAALEQKITFAALITSRIVTHINTSLFPLRIPGSCKRCHQTKSTKPASNSAFTAGISQTPSGFIRI